MNWFWWAIASAFFAGVTAVLAKAGVQGVDSHLATAVRTTVIVIFVWAVVWLSGGLSGLPTIGRRPMLFLFLSGLATGVSWLCYFRALQLGEASKVASIDKLSIVFVLVFAVIFLREKLDWAAAGGIGLILAGALLLTMRAP